MWVREPSKDNKRWAGETDRSSRGFRLKQKWWVVYKKIWYALKQDSKCGIRLRDL